MARRQIRLDQISDHMEGEIKKLVRVTTLEWEKRVKQATPVRVVYEAKSRAVEICVTLGRAKLKGLLVRSTTARTMPRRFATE